MSDNKITGSQYISKVKSLAKEALAEARSEPKSEWRGLAFELAEQYVDGHEWIIYTWAYPWVLMHSEHESALFDEMGSVEATGYAEIMRQMAAYAMVADVKGVLEALLTAKNL